MDNQRGGPGPHNLSTGQGNDRFPSDTLDKPKDDIHPAREFVLGLDEGEAEPSGTG